jgi:hypothetical protein
MKPISEEIRTIDGSNRLTLPKSAIKRLELNGTKKCRIRVFSNCIIISKENGKKEN